jgi:1-phosphofructokinase
MSILCITLNPAIDLTLELAQLQLGAVNRQQHSQSHAAGKGLNVAQVLKDLGHPVMVSGFLGRANRQLFEQHFAAQGFDNQFVYVDGETRQNIKIAEQSGRMTDINGLGFQVTAQDKQHLRDKLASLAEQFEIVVIAGSLPQGFSAEEFQQLICEFSAQHKKVAVDSSGAALAAAIAAQPWMIKPNSDELFESYQLPAQTYQEQKRLFASIATTQIEHIVVSMGAEGVHWLNAQQDLHASAPPVQVKSTVGAGDSLLAAMIHGQCLGLSPEQALKTATAIASHAVTQIGFHVPQQAIIEELKQHITITALSSNDE